MCGPGLKAGDVKIRKLLSQPCRNATPLGKDTSWGVLKLACTDSESIMLTPSQFQVQGCPIRSLKSYMVESIYTTIISKCYVSAIFFFFFNLESWLVTISQHTTAHIKTCNYIRV